MCAVAVEWGPYLSLGEVHQDLPSAALLGVEQPAMLGPPQNPVEQVLGVSACTGAGSQALAAEWLDRLCERQRGLSVLDRSQARLEMPREGVTS